MSLWFKNICREKFIRFLKKISFKSKDFNNWRSLEKSSKIGALVSQQHLEKVLSHIEVTKKDGGILLAGGNNLFQKADAQMDIF